MMRHYYNVLLVLFLSCHLCRCSNSTKTMHNQTLEEIKTHGGTKHSDPHSKKKHKKVKYNLSNVFNQLQPDTYEPSQNTSANRNTTKKFDILQQVYSRLAANRGRPSNDIINLPGAIHVYGPPPKHKMGAPQLPEAAEPFRVVATPHLNKINPFNSAGSFMQQRFNYHRKMPFHYFQNRRPYVFNTRPEHMYMPYTHHYHREEFHPFMSSRGTSNIPENRIFHEMQQPDQTFNNNMISPIQTPVYNRAMNEGVQNFIGRQDLKDISEFDGHREPHEFTEGPSMIQGGLMGREISPMVVTGPTERNINLHEPNIIPIQQQIYNPGPEHHRFEPGQELTVGPQQEFTSKTTDHFYPKPKTYEMQNPGVITSPEEENQFVPSSSKDIQGNIDVQSQTGQSNDIIYQDGIDQQPVQHVFHNHHQVTKHHHYLKARCYPNPCRNSGTCTALEHGYECTCSIGFKGVHCEEINPCQPNPCKNGGYCYETGEGYKCTCIKGYKGEYCEFLDRCHPSPCHNGGKCVEVEDDFHCSCPASFRGRYCEGMDYCSGKPCKNGGSCINVDDKYECVCGENAKGENCEDVDHCHSSPCQNGGQCTGSSTGFTCSCPERYLGPTCHEHESYCEPSPCNNNGKCIETEYGYKCSCPVGFHGDTCAEMSHCASNPCLNNGACIDTKHGFQCVCSHNYFGEKCENPHHSCSHCDPNAACIKENCVCLSGYVGNGRVCEATSQCHPNPCENGGTCHDRDIGFVCNCAGGFVGHKCEEMNPCFYSPCKNDGRCNYIGGGEYDCACSGSFTGRHCEDHNPCYPNPCRYGGACHVHENTFQCGCKNRYKGDYCEVDRCASCDDHAYCDDGACHCHTGYIGNGLLGDCHISEVTSTTVISHAPCIQNPCHNGGTCVDQADDKYKCVCKIGYEGKNCEEKEQKGAADPCSSNPCQNGATCINEGDSVTCKCTDGYFGRYCENGGRPVQSAPPMSAPTDAMTTLKTNPCHPNPCQNGGTCHDFDSGRNYKCICSVGFDGSHCQEDVCSECDVHAYCLHGKCHCRLGFQGDGYECLIVTCDHCHPHATCLIGVCTCNNGWSGNGQHCSNVLHSARYFPTNLCVSQRETFQLAKRIE
ncbi:fibropellin-1-like isoform X3 [Hydractinia symbiolongicarpus]|uniref:fibropellin-1-like isoform X3 n=1 Tax=Hydractinia symbiolongicarpus TaxID=13093 RepID=UPI00254D2502|nr:fibropellin-1-like isoform X3 [Hydractinia symbiolongicarpus]